MFDKETVRSGGTLHAQRLFHKFHRALGYVRRYPFGAEPGTEQDLSVAVRQLRVRPAEGMSGGDARKAFVGFFDGQQDLRRRVVEARKDGRPVRAEAEWVWTDRRPAWTGAKHGIA